MQRVQEEKGEGEGKRKEKSEIGRSGHSTLLPSLSLFSSGSAEEESNERNQAPITLFVTNLRCRPYDR